MNLDKYKYQYLITMIPNTFPIANMNTVSWKELQQLIVKELPILYKQRILQLYCSTYPLIEPIIENYNVHYFGFERDESYVVPLFQQYKQYIKKRKLLVGLLQEEQIPYVQGFFHHIISMSPPTENDNELQDHLQETYRVLTAGGYMALWFTKNTYQEIMATITAVKSSTFQMLDVKILSLKREKDLPINSVLFILKKPPKPVEEKQIVQIVTKQRYY
ncbi:hypothetical protein SAMN05216480_112109 [Pustulibacterium marinum]|uniref:Methyltransferase domain-containing protein n=1 Tax=Pustulibacterium marinum TaxID=1224947 RepID=A0A1I7I2Q1_9FLAO|nr:hypothetical protein [Pustulibacterium marinum]SFU67219.1 hypothetical protein SAMN05216480_112109 [Pustulibacterium marinum]